MQRVPAGSRDDALAIPVVQGEFSRAHLNRLIGTLQIRGGRLKRDLPAEATAEWVSGPYRFEVLEGVSHWIPEVAPVEVSRFVLEHVGSPPVR